MIPFASKGVQSSSSKAPLFRYDTQARYENALDAMRKHLRHSRARHVLIGAVNDASALAALEAFRDLAEYHERRGEFSLAEAVVRSGLLVAKAGGGKRRLAQVESVWKLAALSSAAANPRPPFVQWPEPRLASLLLAPHPACQLAACAPSKRVVRSTSPPSLPRPARGRAGPDSSSRPPTPVQRWMATAVAARCSWMIRRMPLGSTSRIGAGKPCEGGEDEVALAHPAVVNTAIASAKTPERPLGVDAMAPNGIRAPRGSQGSLARDRLSGPGSRRCRAERLSRDAGRGVGCAARY